MNSVVSLSRLEALIEPHHPKSGTVGIKQQFGYANVRYRGLAKNTASLAPMFELGNLRMARRALMEAQG